MKRGIALGAALALLAGCGGGASHSSSSKAKQPSAQQQAAQQLGAAAGSSTTTAGALPDYHLTVEALVNSKVRARLLKVVKATPSAPSDAQITPPSTTCTQSGGTENYGCETSYTVIGASEGFAEQYQVKIGAVCFQQNQCSINSVASPSPVSGTQ